jgi:hypothetical protein
MYWFTSSGLSVMEMSLGKMTVEGRESGKWPVGKPFLGLREMVGLLGG